MKNHAYKWQILRLSSLDFQQIFCTFPRAHQSLRKIIRLNWSCTLHLSICSCVRLFPLDRNHNFMISKQAFTDWLNVATGWLDVSICFASHTLLYHYQNWCLWLTSHHKILLKLSIVLMDSWPRAVIIAKKSLVGYFRRSVQISVNSLP